MKRSISPFALLFASISAILGSGWLFSAFLTAKIAGPASLVAWGIGGLLMVLIAFVFAELCAMIPITGSSTRIPQFTHGTLVSYLFSWMVWLSYLALTPTEVQAVLQYSSFYFPTLVGAQGGLTLHGYIAATCLMLFISCLNTYSLRWLIRSNNILTLLKILIPIIISIAICSHFMTPTRVLHPAHSEFMPFGWHGVFSALATGGIVFAFNGFKQAAEMAGEAQNPKRALPLAIIGSVTATLLIFLLLEVAFLSALGPDNLPGHSWDNLHISNSANSPLAAVLSLTHFDSLLPLLYIGAIISPMAAALMYCGSASRSLYGMSKNGYLPVFFQDLTAQGNPLYAIIFNFILGMCMFAPLPGWQTMVAFLTSLIAVTYAVGPVCLLTLRRNLPEQNRPFRLPCARLWSFLAFYVATLLAYWSGWDILYKMDIGIAIGFVFLGTYRLFSRRARNLPLDWRASLWLLPYFIGLSVIAYCGNYSGILSLFPNELWDYGILAVFCFGILQMASRLSLSKKDIRQYVDKNIDNDDLLVQSTTHM